MADKFQAEPDRPVEHRTVCHVEPNVTGAVADQQMLNTGGIPQHQNWTSQACDLEGGLIV